MIEDNYVIELQRKIHERQPRIVYRLSDYNANFSMLVYPVFLKYKVLLHSKIESRGKGDLLCMQNVHDIIIHFPIY